MDNKQLNEKLLKRAVQLGLCAQWTSEWGSNESQDSLIAKYKRGIDFCIEHDYPNTDFIKANFSRDALLRNLVFVDEAIDMDGTNGIYVLNGKSNGCIRFNGYAVANIYVRHNCNVTIECSEQSKVFITLLDDACLNVIQQGSARCYVYQKSDRCKLTSVGEILVRR